MKLDNNEPTLEEIEDYDGNESKEKRRTVWIVVILGIVIALVYGFLNDNIVVSDEVAESNTTGIFKY